jgi:hypothetical protein
MPQHGRTGLYIAYRTEADDKLAAMEDRKRYTLAIIVSHSDERTRRLTTHPLPDGSSVDALHLTVFHQNGAGRVVLGLTPEQLKSSVESLSTASPMGNAALVATFSVPP